MRKIFAYCLCVWMLFSWSCSQANDPIEKHHKKRDQVVNVRDQIKEIEIEDLIVGRTACPYILDQYLIIGDPYSYDKFVHIVDKNNFKHITSVADKGQGPGELVRLGHVGIDEKNRRLYLLDHGKEEIFSVDLDSALLNPGYMPIQKMKMHHTQLPIDFQYISDTFSIVLLIEPIGHADFKPYVGTWNITTGEMRAMLYEHPAIEKPRITFAASEEHGLYVVCYRHHDLMTICNLEGELKHNIYGPKWDSQKTNAVSYYSDVKFCGDKILALYCHGKDRTEKSDYPTSFLVFDLQGNYLQTLETGYEIVTFCYDKENNRIILNLDDEYRFARLDLNDI